MCYERRFFKSWLRSTAQQREEITPETERSRPAVQPIYQTPEREVTHRKEVERELEEIV